MVKQLIYWGEFRSVAGTLYRVEILSDDTSFIAKQVSFPYEMPVEIEWNEVDKLEPVQGSCMTLSVVSESDRQFIELYSVAVGAIRADVYRDGELYWSGTLDTELYEEPYSDKRDYEVSFTFSDFAILDRKKWSKRGTCSIQEAIDECLSAMGINYNEVRKYISTTADGKSTKPIDLSALRLLCDNFYDEDDEPTTMREVLDEILRPFALRMVQKGGSIYLYDLNAIHSDMATEEVYWDGTDAVLDTDEVYNNVKVTFSPYANAEIINGQIAHDDALPEQSGEALGRLYYVDNDFHDNVLDDSSYKGERIDGFRIYTGEQQDVPVTVENGAKIFRIDEIYSGHDCAGVVWAYKGSRQTYDKTFVNSYFPRVFDSDDKVDVLPIIKTKPVFVAGFSPYGNAGSWYYKLRINLDVLFDVRYNPFEEAARANEEGNWERLNDWCNHGYIPCMLYLKDAEGNILYHYENKSVMNADYVTAFYLGKWVAGAGEWGDMFLAYYDYDDRKSKSGFGGWVTNKRMLGYCRDALPKSWKTAEEGDYIDVPPAEGFLELQIGSGVHQFDYKRKVKDIYSRARWLLYKDPKITIVENNGKAVQFDDVEDSAWINQAAKEDLEIDTIIGTLGKNRSCPVARGLIFNSDYSIHGLFARAGIEDRLERLLIGTVYSQYAQRHNVLSGTVRILPDKKVLTDASTDGKYIMLSEVQDLMQDTSEIKMAEFVADCYDGIEYK